MVNIKVLEFIPNAFSSEQAEKLKEIIHENLKKKNKVNLDFDGIDKFTTLFFNFSTGYFITELGEDEYNKWITVSNLSSLGESIYKNSYTNAVRSDVINQKIQDEINNILNGQDE